MLSAEEHNITTVTTIVSDHLPWSCADLQNKGKRGILGWMENTGVQIVAPPLLTHGHSSRVISEEFSEKTVYNDVDREQGNQKCLDFQVIPGFKQQGRETVLLLGLKEQGEELCHESGERELTGAVAFGREVPPTHGESMIGDRGIDILTSLCSCSLTSCHCLSLTECNRIQAMGSPLMQFLWVSLPGHQVEGRRWRVDLNGANGTYLAQDEALDILLNISEFTILIFNLGKECPSHRVL